MFNVQSEEEARAYERAVLAHNNALAEGVRSAIGLSSGAQILCLETSANVVDQINAAETLSNAKFITVTAVMNDGYSAAFGMMMPYMLVPHRVLINSIIVVADSDSAYSKFTMPGSSSPIVGAISDKSIAGQSVQPLL